PRARNCTAASAWPRLGSKLNGSRPPLSRTREGSAGVLEAGAELAVGWASEGAKPARRAGSDCRTGATLPPGTTASPEAAPRSGAGPVPPRSKALLGAGRAPVKRVEADARAAIRASSGRAPAAVAHEDSPPGSLEEDVSGRPRTSRAPSLRTEE